jgi:hypothetical protein
MIYNVYLYINLFYPFVHLIFIIIFYFPIKVNPLVVIDRLMHSILIWLLHLHFQLHILKNLNFFHLISHLKNLHFILIQTLLFFLLVYLIYSHISILIYFSLLIQLLNFNFILLFLLTYMKIIHFLILI